MNVDVTTLSIAVESKGVKEASRELGGLSTSAANTQRRIEALIESMRKLGTVTHSINMVGVGAGALTNALTQLNTTLTLLNQRTTQTTQSQRHHNESMREAHALARGLSGSLGALWLTYGNFAGMAVGLGIGASLKGIVVVGKDVEHTLEGIRIKGQETTKSVDKMREAIFSLGTGVYGPQEVAHAFETLVLAGLKAEQALVSVNAAMNLAVVGGTTIEKAATTLVSVGTAVGYMAEGFDRVGDVIAKTAALSMSSVASLSEAFKSASSVNKLYGVTLEDIGTGLGILSNLGIQGSAAGTAMKNFYKELAAGNEKVTATLKSMGLTQQSFKDTKGFFLPFVDVIKILDTGLKRLTESQQKVALANLTNERGMRLGVQALGEYNTKVGESSNALIEFQKAVTDSHGFAAIGAVAMSLTAESQIKKMLNSLKTAFAETFTEMQPEIIAFTGRMKSIFKSDEFKSGLMFLAQSFANLAVAIANNLPYITAFIVGFTAVKVIMAGAAMWSAAAAGIAMVGAALQAASVGALTFTAALGPLALLLAGVAAALLLYNNAKSDANKHTQMATDYSKGYLEGLTEEANRLSKINLELDKKKTLQEATAELTRGEARDKMNELNKKAVDEAQDNLKNGIKWTGYTKIAQTKELARVTAKMHEDNRLAMEREYIIKEQSRQIDEKVKKQALDNRPSGGGEGTLNGGPDKSAINDAYQAKLLVHLDEVKSAKRKARAFEDQQNALFRNGEISRLEFIESTFNKEVEMYQKAQAAREAAKDTASKAGNKTDYQRFKGEIEQAEEDMSAKKIRREIDEQGAVKRAVQDATKFRIAELEKIHSYSVAASERWGAENNESFKDAELAAEKYGKQYPVLITLVNQYKAAKRAAINEGLDKESIRAFNIELDAVNNAMKVVTSVEGQGLAEMFNAATAATETYKAKLATLRTEAANIKDPLKRGEAEAEITRSANNFKKMWSSVGETISESLEKAFGRGGKAMGELFKVAKNYENLENKTGAARTRAYGDAAGAAKNFFKEGTTGYKVMETAERAFRAIEMAGMIQSLVMTGTVEAGKQAFKVPTVLMEFMSQMGLPGLAIGAAAIAAIGVSASRGGSAPASSETRQKRAGVGSVLGGGDDTKSESISKSLEIMERNSGLGLVHSNEMVKALRNIEKNIGAFSSFVLRNKVGAASQESDTTNGFFQKIGNSLFGGKSTVQDNGIKVGSFSLNNLGSLAAQNYTDIKKDGGLFRGDKFSTTTSAIDGKVNDQFKQIIKSLEDGVISAANSLGMGGDAFTAKLKTFVVDIGEISLKGLSGEEVEKQFQSIFAKLGDEMAAFGIKGLESFQKVGEGYFETVARVANNLMQVKDVFAILGKELTATGTAAINVSEGLISSAGSLEKLTEGTKYFVDNFLSESERMEPIAKSVKARLAELNISQITSIEIFKDKVKALDLTNAADQALYTNLLELAPTFKEAADYSDKLAKGIVELTDAQKLALDIAKKKRELEIELMDAQGFSQEALNARRKDEIAELNKLSPVLGSLQGQINDADDMAKRRSDAKSVLEAAYQRESAALQGVIDKFKQFATSLKKFKDELITGTMSTLSPEQKYLASKAKFESTAALAGTGDETALAEFQSVSQEFLNLSRDYNASTAAYTSDFNMVQKGLADAASAAQIEVNIATSQLSVMQQQYEALLGIQKLLSFNEALKKYGDLMDPVKSAPPAKGSWFGVEEVLAAIAASNAAMTTANGVDGSHYNGLDSVPKDNYLAKLHKGERVQTANSAKASDANNAATVEILNKVLEKMSNMEENTSAALSQTAAVNAGQAERDAEMREAMLKMARELAKAK